MEKIYADAVYAMQSDDAEWWEKSAAQGWLRFLEVARQFSIPASFETIQFFRTTFAYDAVIMRLHKDIDVTKEWEAYAKEAAKEARQRVQKSMQQRRRGLDRHGLCADGGIRRHAHSVCFPAAAKHRESDRPFQEHRRKDRLYRIAGAEVRLARCRVGSGIGLVADAIARRWFGHQIDWASILERATTFGWVQLVIVVVSWSCPANHPPAESAGYAADDRA